MQQQPLTPTATPKPIRFRIHAQATHNNTNIGPCTISDEVFSASTTGSFCSLENKRLALPVRLSQVDHIDNVIIKLSAVQEAPTPLNVPGTTFACVNVLIGDYRDKLVENSKKQQQIKKKKKYSNSPETSIATRARLKYGHDDDTREIKRQAATIFEKQIARWRTGNIAFKLKASGLPKKKGKTKAGLTSFITSAGGALGQASTVQPTISDVVEIVLTLKTIMRTQQNTSSEELAKINIESDLKRMKKDRQNLTIVIAVVFSFLIVGAIFYPLVEGWTILDSLYFGVTTLTTVGYGDMGPTTNGSKIFTALYVFFGVAIVATLIGLATTFLIEAAALAADLDKKEKRELAMNDDSDDSDDSDDDDMEEDDGDMEEGGEKEGRPKDAVILAMENSGSSSIRSQKSTCLSRCIKRGTFFFHEFLPAFICCTIGILVMMYGQDATFVDAFYWSIVTGTTVGYGDISPSAPGTRAFALVYLFAAVITMGKALSAFGSLLEADDGHADALLNRKLDEKFLVSLDSDGTGEVSEFEYLSAMMVLLEYVEQDDIDNVMKAFRKLDTDGSGSLTVDDLVQSRKSNSVNNLQTDLRRPKKVFKDCDTNQNGSLERTEVRSALQMLGSTMNDEDFDAMFHTMDKDNDGNISYAEFKKVLYARIIYAAIDDDVNGSLDRDEIRESIEIILELTITDTEFEKLFKELDTDASGCVTFIEYKKHFHNPGLLKSQILVARQEDEGEKKIMSPYKVQ